MDILLVRESDELTIRDIHSNSSINMFVQLFLQKDRLLNSFLKTAKLFYQNTHLGLFGELLAAAASPIIKSSPKQSSFWSKF
mgnify:CR=1 FL=1